MLVRRRTLCPNWKNRAKLENSNFRKIVNFLELEEVAGAKCPFSCSGTWKECNVPEKPQQSSEIRVQKARKIFRPNSIIIGISAA
jgi:hypothetical protein